MWAWAGLLVTSAVVAYILIGYPILLALIRCETPLPKKNPEYRCRVTVIMAVYNGADFLRQKLESILALHYPKELMQILVISDGSTDGTDAIAAEYTSRGVDLVRIPRSGKAACLNASFGHATGDVLFFTDVRQSLDVDALAELVANFADPSVGAVTGEMQLLPGDSGEHTTMDLYWRYEIWARRRHSQIDSIFSTTGCLYAMRRELAAKLPPDTLSDDAVLSLNAFFSGYRVIVEPKALAFDYPAISGTEFRRRWRNLAGLWQLHARMPELFTSANRMRWHFLSHKFARLALPWAMLGVLIFTAALPSLEWRNSFLTGDLVFLGLALFDDWIPHWLPLKRLSSAARTFGLMNAASFAALAVFFIPARKIWKTTQPALLRETGFL